MSQEKTRQIYVPPVVPGAPQLTDIRDAQDNRMISIFAYIFFFIPLLTGTYKTSPFAKFHMKQGVALFIVTVAYSILSGVFFTANKISIKFWDVTLITDYTLIWVRALIWFFLILIGILCAVGIINAAKGRKRPLPIIGKFTKVK